jgi:lantibiotic modifying enzyme
VTAEPDHYRDVAEAAWRWVLNEVRHDDGPWIPAAATAERAVEPPTDRDGMHSGVGGLAHVLAEIREVRPWTDEESELAQAIAGRVRSAIPEQTDATYFDGLVSTIGVLVALQEPGVELAVARLATLATPDGWPHPAIGPPRYLPGARINDLTLGTAGVLVGAVWAARHGAEGAIALAEVAADVLLREAEPRATGMSWSFVSERFVVEPPATQMPNLSHGLAGIAAALAVAGTELARPDLVTAAASGAEHLVSLGDTRDDGFVVPRTIPAAPDLDEVTYTWCHGPAGTSLLFRALEHAGVAEVATGSPESWQRRCLESTRASGLPARLWPGFWDNDGRCCGTAGVGEVFLDSWHHSGQPDDLAFAIVLADTLVERGLREGEHVFWRFVEHRNDDPLLPPGVGWMQGAAGIAAYLFHVSRVLERGADADSVPRMDTWWAT